MNKILKFTTNKKSPITFPDGISIALINENSIVIGIKARNLKDENITDFCNNEIKLGFLNFEREETKAKHSINGFAIYINEFIDLGIAFSSFNASAKTFKLTPPIYEDKGYVFNFILVDDKDTVIITRQIGTSQEFSKVIYDAYLKTINEINEVVYLNENILWNEITEAQQDTMIYLSKYSIEEVLDKFTLGYYEKREREQ